MNSNQIVLLHGTQYREMAVRLMERVDLASDIGRWDARIGIKPNLVVEAPASNGATTHPELVAGVIEYLQKNGFRKLCVMESSWVGASTQAACRINGMQAVCEKYQVPFLDLQKDAGRTLDAAGMKIKVCESVLDVDYMINMPVLKGHCQTNMTCALKNGKGLIPNAEKRRFHTMGLHEPIARLNTVVPRGMILVDNICGDLDFEEGGNPVPMNRIYCCKDPVLCDSFACQVIGYAVDDVPYIRLAEALGVGSTDLEQAEIIFLNEGSESAAPPKMTRRVEQLSGYALPRDACSACYGSLIYALNQMERQGALRGRSERICIGQGYRGQAGKIGVGTCTCGFDRSLRGCPPKTADMIRFLTDNWK